MRLVLFIALCLISIIGFSQTKKKTDSIKVAKEHLLVPEKASGWTKIGKDTLLPAILYDKNSNPRKGFAHAQREHIHVGETKKNHVGNTAWILDNIYFEADSFTVAKDVSIADTAKASVGISAKEYTAEQAKKAKTKKK